MNKANLSVFASGVGSNLLAIHNASKDKCFPGKLQLVICNKICPAFELAKSLNYETKLISNLDINEFYEWASDHFGLDTYYEDSEDLVDHVKSIFRIDGDLLDNNEDYKFVTKMIGRSEPSYLNLQF